MDIWEKLFNSAKGLYNPHEVSSFIYAEHVVCALEAENGEIYTGYCFEASAGVFHLCAERAAAFNMYQFSKQTKIKRLIAFRNEAPSGVGGMPCGACREFLMQLNSENAETEIMIDYNTKETIKLAESFPKWWGEMRTQ
ncbi:cytidine deaminase [Holzapfeliella sp. He02]|uniref:Cytidine deaminase n=1 Tax=Holzapfeliella saturejae TaxID=3082953 RepID=A0ABU8SG87_9LACO